MTGKKARRTTPTYKPTLVCRRQIRRSLPSMLRYHTHTNAQGRERGGGGVTECGRGDYMPTIVAALPVVVRHDIYLLRTGATIKNRTMDGKGREKSDIIRDQRHLHLQPLQPTSRTEATGTGQMRAPSYLTPERLVSPRPSLRPIAFSSHSQQVVRVQINSFTANCATLATIITREPLL